MMCRTSAGLLSQMKHLQDDLANMEAEKKAIAAEHALCEVMLQSVSLSYLTLKHGISISHWRIRIGKIGATLD